SACEGGAAPRGRDDPVAPSSRLESGRGRRRISRVGELPCMPARAPFHALNNQGRTRYDEKVFSRCDSHHARAGRRPGGIGGIGAEERAAMEAKAADYNLRLTFATKVSGAYLSDVKVAIRNARGETVLDTVAAGPWLFARLPRGEYRVAASAFGQTLAQSL